MSYIEYVTGDVDRRDPVEELAEANGFTLADLEANRKGKISEKQRSRLYAQALEPVRYPAGALFGWLLCCFVIKTLVPDILLMLAAVISGQALGVVFGGVTLGCVVSLIAALAKSGRRVVLLFQDLSAGLAECIDGRVTPSREDRAGLGLDKFHGEKHGNFWYVIHDEYFEVSPGAHAVLSPGRYRLYCTPKSRLLLAIEPAVATAA